MLNIHIRRNSDGKRVVYCDDSEWDATREYMWAEGNYACDCNRSIFFSNATGNDDDCTDCGSDGFSVRICDEAGNEVYVDDNWPSIDGDLAHLQIERDKQ